MRMKGAEKEHCGIKFVKGKSDNDAGGNYGQVTIKQKTSTKDYKGTAGAGAAQKRGF